MSTGCLHCPPISHNEGETSPEIQQQVHITLTGGTFAYKSIYANKDHANKVMNLEVYCVLLMEIWGDVRWMDWGSEGGRGLLDDGMRKEKLELWQDGCSPSSLFTSYFQPTPLRVVELSLGSLGFIFPGSAPSGSCIQTRGRGEREREREWERKKGFVRWKMWN